MATYTSILSTAINDIKDVPPMPEGSYLATIVNTPKVGNFGQKSTPGVEFAFRINSPMEDVDPEVLTAAGGVPELPLTYTFWDTPKAGGMLKEFLANVLQLDGSRTPLDWFPELPGHQVVLKIGYRYKNNDKSTRPFPNIVGFAHAG